MLDWRVGKERLKEAFPLLKLYSWDAPERDNNFKLLLLNCSVATCKRLPGEKEGKCINMLQCTAVNYTAHLIFSLMNKRNKKEHVRLTDNNNFSNVQPSQTQ